MHGFLLMLRLIAHIIIACIDMLLLYGQHVLNIHKNLLIPMEIMHDTVTGVKFRVILIHSMLQL